MIRALMLLPLIIPSIVYAIGLYRYFGKLDLLDRFLGVVLAHGVTGIPYVVVTVSTALATFDPRLEQAARGIPQRLGQRHAFLRQINRDQNDGCRRGMAIGFKPGERGFLAA